MDVGWASVSNFIFLENQVFGQCASACAGVLKTYMSGQSTDSGLITYMSAQSRFCVEQLHVQLIKIQYSALFFQSCTVESLESHQETQRSKQDTQMKNVTKEPHHRRCSRSEISNEVIKCVSNMAFPRGAS